MKSDIRNLTFLGIITAALLVGGYFLYIISKTLPIPGSKFVFMAPYLSIFMYIAISKTKKLWTMTIVSFIFGGIMFFINPFMTMSIFLSGVLADLITVVFIRNYGTERNISISASLYPVWSFIIGVGVTNYITGNYMYKLFGIKLFALLIFIIYILGFIGTKVGFKLKSRFIIYGKNKMN
ncbi:hypothetical protein [Maledivibacter halophilus]|uniref:Energy-coupling factor transport system substrate-specific component n=1 Tax=Maledivibacter halophilus TaxID=36842 RepID=A0A1T5MPL3_9FIRM|nr:hypothetical protein [Maledivibacter halophilus]SKC89828.1 hypothetical protein SAMN02194393_05082 [Maledivibacter halophilus]